MSKHRRPIEERFWEKVDTSAGPDGCWIWRGSTVRGGYGKIGGGGTDGRKIVPVHRLSWEIANGPIPEGLLVCHHCDNPPCVNPMHLFLGTDKDNVDDMIRKGRNRLMLHLTGDEPRRPRHTTKQHGILCIGQVGETNLNSKLTADVVCLIRRLADDGLSQKSLAARFHTCASNIYSILSRRTWKHI